MNNSYRVVWSLAHQSWVAVPETATGKGKTSVKRPGKQAPSSFLAAQLSPLAAALLFVFAGGALQEARAATYTAATQAELITAINQANADSDPSSTINLTANLTITTPALIPAVTKALTIAPGAFTLSTTGTGNFNASAPLTISGRVTSTGALTKDGAGTTVLTGTGSTVVNNINVTAGALRVEGGGQIAFGSAGSGGLTLSGNNTSATITGAGSRMNVVAGQTTIGSTAGSTLNIENGGFFNSVGTFVMAGVAGTTGTLNVTGANSRLAISNPINVARGTAFINVTNGGRIQSDSATLGGTPVVSQGGTATVLVSGAGSRWDSIGLFVLHGGSLSILDGGVVSVSTLNIATAATSASSTLVSDAGSQLVSTNNIGLGSSGTGTLTIANGGQVTSNGGAGILNVALNAAGRGTLNIGGASGQAATAAGTLNVATVQFGAGTGIVNFNHTDASYTFNPVIAGNGSVVHNGPGTTVLGGANTYTGSTTINAGTLRASGLNRLAAASAYTVGAGGTLDLAGFGHTLPSLNNSGTVSTVGAAPGTNLTVTGAYVGNGGTLRLGTALGASNSLTDRLVLNGAGASASGNTLIQVVNLGGLGAQTSGNGIEVVTAQGGATTTATAFALSNGHVDAGIYEYNIYRGTADQNWYLRSAQGAVPTYRAEVPLVSALPTHVRLADTAMLGNRNLRGGDASVGATDTPAIGRNAWGRLVSTDIDVTQPGFANPNSAGRLNGFQSGTDLVANTRWRAGVYVGALDGSVQVSGFARGVQGPVGNNKLRARYLGGYASWENGSGFYADAVLQAGYQDYTLRPTGSAWSSARSSSLLASIEIGQSFAMGNGWSVEPQLQLVHQHIKLDDLALSNAGVQQDSPDSLTTRIGVRVKTETSTDVGVLKPYGRLNFYRASSGLDTARFGSGAATTDVSTRSGGSWAETAVGATLAIDKTWSVYGEVGRLFNGGGDVAVRSDVSASLGVVARW
ncbi:autotransporter outer membrane beta-barrel domain-containing protein [Polaromonas sp. JS666]|uniref:autotransporter outer membrane beta-barrel domain-containing protein n=1 Tax=Polaromonas sp. (strain JS666 / ATCC BAA-500) TaxID=296591 RepID=UPI0008917E18|nr:autotransporter outer membrane beta-barrel domain-containing protein [Polaromonas sp. JS666]SDN54045.1 outer membrane autotransporter barrel domain-containing protein [Polaromonas sp. JS666]